MRGLSPNDYIHHSLNEWDYIDQVTCVSSGCLMIYLNSEKTQLDSCKMFNS